MEEKEKLYGKRGGGETEKGNASYYKRVPAVEKCEVIIGGE